MPSNDALIADLAGAILDGAPIDWASAAASVDPADRSMFEQLRVLSGLARHHRQNARSSASDPHDREETSGASANGPEQWGHLQLLERIGGGEFGDVYRAWDPRLDREVALKLLRVSSCRGDPRDASIIEEGRLLARVRHPNIVTIYGAERLGGRIGLWMELVKGRTLQQALEQGKMFSPAEAIDIGIQLCQAIAAVHEAGLLHRDVKPHNAMLAQDGRVVLMDFGAGLRLGDRSRAPLAGTPLYLAPELLRGEGPSVRSDVYSAGVVLFYLLTGSYPVRAYSLDDLRGAHERREPIDIRLQRPDVPARFARAIARAIDPAPEHRYQRATDFAEALAAVNARSAWARAAAGAVIVLTIAAGLMWISAHGAQSAAGRSPFPGAAVSPVDWPVIAVLPFENLGPSDSDYFAEGLTDEITRSLAQVRGMDVRSRNSSARFGANPSNLRDLGQQLGANLVLGGSVLQSGQRLRINAELTQISGDVVLWAGQFDRELKDLFVIQDDISRAIVNKLRLTLGRGQRRYDIDLDAYELYLEARAMVGRQGASIARRAVALFEQVIAMDPSFAPAYAGLADAYAAASQDIPDWFKSDPISPERALALMRPTAEKALLLDPLLADAHAAMGQVYSRGREWQKADESFRRAVELNPSLSSVYTTYVSSTLLPLGKFDEADEVLQTALRTDPLSLDVRRALAELQIITGRYDEAIDNLQRIESVDAGFPYADLHFARALTFAGRIAEALPRWDAKKDEPGMQHWMAYAYMRAGRRDTVEKIAASQTHPYRLGMTYTALGDKDRAFEALSKAADLVPERVAVLTVYPELAPLRGDPRFAALRQKLGLPSLERPVGRWNSNP